jgi:uncharacterized protein (DUF488 family)
MATVFTIGYEGTNIASFVAKLRATRITVLADVRALPLSRKKGFSKNGLRNYLEEQGIRYVHFGELGDPKEGREAARAGRHADFKRVYAKHVSGAVPQAAMIRLAELACNEPTCLMCFERDPAICHRSIIADHLQRRGLTVSALFVDGTTANVGGTAQLPRGHSREGTAAAQ